MTKQKLKPTFYTENSDHKVLVVVVDGFGISEPESSLTRNVQSQKGIIPDAPFRLGNAANAAYMPNMQKLMSGALYRTLRAHGTAVGLPSEDDMGNSEVGHNAMGAGRVFAQGAKLINEAIASKEIYRSEGWMQTVERSELKSGQSTLHFLGLLSDGNVHSHIRHLFALLEGAKQSGVKKVKLHTLLDGRDVPPTSALQFVDQLESFLKDLNDSTFHCEVASGGGRMFVTMDRYESDWRIVERGYNAHILGEARTFHSLREAIETLRIEKPGITDQDLPPFVIARDEKPVGAVQDGDSFVLFNFRGDRAIEISRALEEKNFSGFVRKRTPHVHFAGMMQYDGDLKIPKVFLVNPPLIRETSGELFAASGVKQFACSETQKFGHVTYFWNGNRSGKFDSNLEEYVEVPSDLVPFSERPWMKAAEITDATIDAMQKNSFRVGRINFANGDMVGHTGNLGAAIVAMGSVDLALGRLMRAAEETNTTLIVTADHGNADEMFERDKKTGKVVFDAHGNPKAKTSHTLSPVPFAIFNTSQLEKNWHVEMREDLPQAGLANIAATVMTLLGFEPPKELEPSCVRVIPKDGSKKKEHLSTVNSNEVASKPTRRLSPAAAFDVAESAVDFAETVHRLRAPDGCPWDKEQTFASLETYMVEECYEAVSASQQLTLGVKGAEKEFCSELGDVLLQVFLNAEIACEKKLFSVSDVFRSIDEKMIRRHPHVFAKNSGEIETADAVVTQWDKIKDAERSGSQKSKTLMHKAMQKKALPTLNYATAVAKRSYKLGFAWPTLKEVFGDLQSEVQELAEEIFVENPDWSKVKDELGDIGYALSCVTTHLNQKMAQEIDLDVAVRAATEKFLTRFQEMETILAEEGVELTEDVAKNMDLGRWDDLWKKAKQRRYR